MRRNAHYYDTLAFSNKTFLKWVNAGKIVHGKNVHWSRYANGKRRNKKVVGRASVTVAKRLFAQVFSLSPSRSVSLALSRSLSLSLSLSPVHLLSPTHSYVSPTVLSESLLTHDEWVSRGLQKCEH